MRKPTVLVHSEEPELALDILSQTHPDISPAICTNYSDLESDLRQFKPEVVFTCRSETKIFPREDLLNSDSIAWISNAGSGINHILPWNPDKVTVTNSAGVAADMMAEYVLGVMLYFSLDIPGLKQDQQNHHWRYREVSPINGKTLLIIGLGKTGQAMANKAKALDMNVIGVRARVKPTDNIDQVYATDQLPIALPQADFILICVPLLDSTKAMIGKQEFEAVKPGVVLIDVSRGGIVQERALIEALDNGKLSAAGLDVFETEPLAKNNPLWDYPNVLISPHCSSVYDGWEKRSAEMFAENLKRWRNGEKLLNIVNPDRGY